ncbi:flagellar export chaperone FliS [Thalassotalea fusca]
MRQNLKAYKKVNIESSILSANPHQIIVMMYDGLLESIAQAKGAIERKDLDTKSKLMTKSVNILTALINALDKESQPEISANFENLYSACIVILNNVNVTLETAGLDEVQTYIKPLRDAWRDMPMEAKQDGLEQLKQKKHSEAIGA